MIIFFLLCHLRCTGNYWDAAGWCHMWLLLRYILRSAVDYHWSHRTASYFRVNRLSNLRVS